MPIQTLSGTPTLVYNRRVFEQYLSNLHNFPDLTKLKELHSQILKSDLHDDLFVAPKLMIAFSLCGRMELAVNVFDQIEEPNVRMYNDLIRAYVQSDHPLQAFSAFMQMQTAGLSPDNFTYPFLLKACYQIPSIRVVQMIHAHIEKFGLYWDIFVPNSLIDNYSRCGSSGVNSAKMVFTMMSERDVVSWNSMLSGFIRAGEFADACQLFDEIPDKDIVSWNTMLDGYAKVGNLDSAFELFNKMPIRDVVSWCTMVTGFCSAGDMDMARMLFDKMPVKNLVTWTVIISGYAQNGNAKDATLLYDQFEEMGWKPDEGAFVRILSACAESGLLCFGKKVHASIRKTRFKCCLRISNLLIDMYARSGSLRNASKIFNDMEEKDLVSWNTMIKGLAIHGHGYKSLHLFSKMKFKGFKPDDFTFIGVLCACTHSGLVDLGLHYFLAMEKEYGIVPQVEHYGCLIDLLGRKGYLHEAFKIVYRMPFEPTIIIWGTLLGACRLHNNVGLAGLALKHLAELEQSDVGNYSMLLNTNVAAKDWDNVVKLRTQMKCQSMQKPSDACYIETENNVHEYQVADQLHSKSDDIYSMVKKLSEQLKRGCDTPNE